MYTTLQAEINKTVRFPRVKSAIFTDPLHDHTKLIAKYTKSASNQGCEGHFQIRNRSFEFFVQPVSPRKMENRDSEGKSENKTYETSSEQDGFSSMEVIGSTNSGEASISTEESPSIVIISSEDACDIESPIVISSEENELRRDIELLETRSFEILDGRPNLCSTPGPKGKKAFKLKLICFSATR